MSLVATTKSLPSPAALAHLWALGAVAVATATEERDDAAAGVRGELAGQDDEIAQGVVGVGVVDDHREGLAGIDRLKAPGHGFKTRNE